MPLGLKERLVKSVFLRSFLADSFNLDVSANRLNSVFNNWSELLRRLACNSERRPVRMLGS